MPLTGALQADFSPFVEEAKKATMALDQMDAEAKKMGATLAKTGQAVDGFGTKAAPNLSQLTTGLRTMDATANALGVNMAKPIQAIEELGRVSGQTVAQLGLLGTAGVAVGVAITGWELGKWISDMTGGLETAKVWQDRLYGSADAADAAANKQAVLNLAFLRTGQVFTDVTLAQDALNAKTKEGTEAVQNAAYRQGQWEGELRQFGGALPRMLEALANHTATVKQLSAEYKISEGALTYYIAKQRDEEAALKAVTAAAAPQLAAQKELTELRKGYGVQLMSINAETLKAVQADLALGAGQATVAAAYGLTAGQVKAANDQLETNIKITTGLGAEWANVGERVKITADSVVADTNRMKDAAKAYEAETQRMADEFSKTQAKDYKAPIDKTKESIKEAKQEAQGFTLALQDMSGAAKLSVHELLQAGLAMDDAYRKAGLFVQDIGAAGTARFLAASRAGVMMPTTGGDFTTAMRGTPGVGQQWGTGQGAIATTNTLNVNVNSTDANNIATKLVTEMRHQGVRF